MSQIFLRLIAVIGLLALIVIGIGHLLPRDYRIVSKIDIQAAPADVYGMINSLPNWQYWSPWNSADIPDLEIQYSGPQTGVGRVQKWQDRRGQGELTITRSEPATGIEYKMRFANFPEMTSTLSFDEISTGTQVTWNSQGTLPRGAFYGYFSLLFEGQMKYEYDKGLSKLKKTLETDN